MVFSFDVGSAATPKAQPPTPRILLPDNQLGMEETYVATPSTFVDGEESQQDEPCQAPPPTPEEENHPAPGAIEVTDGEEANKEQPEPTAVEDPKEGEANNQQTTPRLEPQAAIVISPSNDVPQVGASSGGDAATKSAPQAAAPTQAKANQTPVPKASPTTTIPPGAILPSSSARPAGAAAGDAEKPDMYKDGTYWKCLGNRSEFHLDQLRYEHVTAIHHTLYHLN